MMLMKASLALTLCLLGSGVAQDAKQELQSIQKELDQEFKELSKATKELQDEGAVGALYEEFQQKILPEFGERFAKVARANKGTVEALDAWTKVLGLVSQGMGGSLPGEALSALTTDHLQSETLGNVAANLRFSAPMIGEEKVLLALRKIAQGSPHRKVQATALYSLAAVLGEERAPDDPRLAEAKKVLAELASYDDVESPDGRSYAKSAAALLFSFENLSPGRPCPDFHAVDAEGASFKLSDYRGKVVLVDFWGFW